MGRVRRLHSIVFVSLILLATACSTDSNRSDTKSGGGAAKSELVVAAGRDANRLDPPERATVATGTGDANAPVFEPLVQLAPDFSIEPGLATSWEFQAPNTWRFHLRDGVKFHNGEPFDAKAVAYNVTDLWSKAPSALALGPGSASVVDNLTIDITPIEPNLRLVEQLVHPSFGIKAPGTYAGAGTAPANTPTGTGPFKFSAYEQGNFLEVERFDDYWGPKAKSARIRFRFLSDNNTRILALRAGDVDAVYDVAREQASQVAKDGDLTAVKSPVGAYDAILLNHLGKPPYDILSDQRVRRAIAAGIDKASIVNNVWKGNAEVATTLIPAPVLAGNAKMVEGVAFDRAEARRLLDEAGWITQADGSRTKAGRRLQLTLVVAEPELQQSAVELAQAQLKDIGIDIQLELPSAPAAYFERLAQGEGDIFAERGTQNDGNPMFLGSLFTVQGFPEYAQSFGAGPAYDDVFKRAAQSPETEVVRRLAAEAMKIAVDDEVVVVPIAGIQWIWGLSRDVQGFRPHPSAINQRWVDVYVAP